MKLALKIIIPILLLGLALVFGLRQWQPEVLVGAAVKGTAVNAVTGTAEVFAYMDIYVKAEQRGIVLEQKAEAGQQVKKDDVIAVQSSKDLDLQLKRLQIHLDAALKKRELQSTTQLDLETINEQIEGTRLAVELDQAPKLRLERELREKEKKEIEIAYREIEQHETVDILRVRIEEVRHQIEQMTIKAPFEGTVVSIQAFKGDLLNWGNNVVRLVSNGRYAILELSEEDYFGVAKGQPVTLRLASYPDRTFTGEVSSLEQFADSSTKTRNVVIDVEAVDSDLVPGLTGEGYLVKSERADAVLIPRRALIGNRVYVVKDGVVEIRKVKRGYLGLNQAEILEGIELGEQVILEGQSGLREGDSVSVVTSRS